MTNYDLTNHVFKQLLSLGVNEFCLCAGARNAPFVEWLSPWQKDQSPSSTQDLPPKQKSTGDFVNSSIKIYSFFDERAAAFFALGRIKQSLQPVAVLTTSGTAVAELLPATVEAHYSELPLILVTADRPKRFRGTGAPQCIEHMGIYSNYVEQSYDLDVEFDNWSEVLAWTKRRPLHFNVCFDEPLLSGFSPQSQGGLEESALRRTSEKVPMDHTKQKLGSYFCAGPKGMLTDFSGKKPLFLVGELPASLQEPVYKWLSLQSGPVFLESLSGLWGRELSHRIQSGEKLARYLVATGKVDSVVRLGGVPTTRLWRDLDTTFAQVPVLNLSHRPYSGLSRDNMWTIDLGDFLTDKKNTSTVFTELPSQEGMCKDQEKAQSILQLFKEFPLSEVAWVWYLLSQLPVRTMTFVGNSLPIREWDLVGNLGSFSVQTYANRGANGIDGLLSTFYGCASAENYNLCLLGDLSTLYDLNAPWALAQREIKQSHIVVLNNCGGKIFERLFKNPLFLNSHSLDFCAWAKMWSLAYMCPRQPEGFELSAQEEGHRLTEICPDEKQSGQFWSAYEELWS